MNLPDINPTATSAWIKQQALQLGFSLVGVTTPDPPPHLDRFRRWLRLGHHAGMDYLAREDAIAKRADPCLLLPECQSIIVTGTSYAIEDTRKESESLEFQVAAYALGQDYHRVLLDRMQALARVIEKEIGAPIPHRIYTDSGPLLERELAQRSGLGWIGKNTCLIHPKQGSLFLLAELLLGVPLEADDPFLHDRCGSCTRCIDACPTQCILPDRTINAGQCISYLTIENKESIPRELRDAVGDWVFGCDICQQVCPWNLRFSKKAIDPTFAPGPFLRQARLSDFLRLPPGHWRSHLGNSPLERPRRRGLVRNAAVVAGNRADSIWIDDLSLILEDDPEPLARSHAAWALGQIHHPRSSQVLERSLALELDPSVLDEIKAALHDH
jgi:epoxyqueuosine reductase